MVTTTRAGTPHARVVRRAGESAREAALLDEDVRDRFWRSIAITRHAQGEQP